MSINKIPLEAEFRHEPQRKYRFVVTDLEAGEVIYDNEGFAGLIVFMEKVKVYGETVEGDHQLVGWGSPLLQMYCHDQLSKFGREVLPKVLEEAKALGFIKTNLTPKDLGL